MKIKRPFAPSIINTLDEHLLINNPTIWSTRVHLVLYYGGLFLLFLFGLSWLVPNDARNDTNIGVWATIISIISLIGIVFWIIYLLRFNVFKRFGEQKTGDGITTFLLYFLAIGIFIMAPFIPSYVETIRAQKAYKTSKVYDDINRVNTIICQIEYDSIPHAWNDRIYYLRQTDNTTIPPYLKDEEAVRAGTILDSSEFYNTLKLSDSVVLVEPGVAKIYECPDYQFLAPYNASEKGELRLLKSQDLYHLVLQNFKKPDTAQLQRELRELLNKYSSNLDARNYVRYYENENPDNYAARIDKKYGLREMDDSINNILSKQSRWNEYGWEVFLRLFYYITICVALFVFIFRHSTPKTFFLSILTSVILAILTMLLMTTSRSDSPFIFGILLFYYMLFAGFSIAAYSTATRRAITGIAINLFVYSTMFIPLIVVGWYYAIDDNRDYITRPVDYYSQKQLHFLIAEIAGGVILLLLIEPLFKKLYRKWWAQPEN